MRSPMIVVVAALLAIAADLATAAPTCQKTSGTRLTALVELYTSEGCSSCPPADAWLRRLPAAGFPPERTVPIALHVDYWDHIGWKDAFANPRFTARQRAIAERGGSRFVYTPQVVVNGRDYRAWSSSAFAAAIDATHRRPAKAEIRLEIAAGESSSATIRAEATLVDADDRSSAALFLVPYQSGLVTRVTAGENGGATLRHDFVAREWIGPLQFDASGRAHHTVPLTARLRIDGVAAFVQKDSGELLQAMQLGCAVG